MTDQRGLAVGNDWFNSAYPDPSDADPSDADPSVDDEAVHPRATAWFKPSAAHLVDRVPPYLEILRAHDVECVRVEVLPPRHVRSPHSAVRSG